MKRQSMKWLGNIVLVVSILLFCSTVKANDEIATSKESARQQYEQFRGVAGSPSGLRNNFVNPLIGGGNLKTIDLSQEGNAQIACPSSREFLTVLIQPTGTGDFHADIYWDSDLDGRMDKSLTINNISGVCANGFISCNPGTWDNCSTYAFVYNEQNKALETRPVGLYDLSGCFCVNNSCGTNLVWQNLSTVLKTFAGAVAGILQQANPRYTISQARVEGPAIYFYGQSASDCTIVQTQGGVAKPENLYSPTNETKLVMARENEVIAQQGDPYSLYNLMKKANEAQQSVINSCFIQRNVSEVKLGLYDIISPISGNGGSVRECGDRCIRVVLGWEGDNYWCASCSIYTLYYDLLLKRPDLIESAILVYAAWDDWIQFWLNDYLLWNGPYGNWTSPTDYPPGSCELSTSWRWGLNVSADSFFVGVLPNTVLRTKIRVAVSGCGEGYGLLDLRVKSYCDVIENVSNTCNQFEEDPTCVLWNERVDGVQTIKEGVRTGLNPYYTPECVFICNNYHCYDFMRIEREYLCDSNPADLSYAKKRLATVVPSSSYNNSQLRFDDIRYENNTWTSYPNQVLQIQGEPLGDDCEKICRVKKPFTRTQIGTSGPVSKMKPADSTGDFVYFYRACYKDQCPLQEGEILDRSCTCANDFGAAATIMQTLRMAGRDIICSSGNIRTVPGY